MRDPITWSFPLARLFGIHIRVHITLPVVLLGLILHVTTNSTVTLPEAAVVMLLLFLAILVHELGHCFAARSVEGDASEVLLWPLGGLAYCDLPHTPRAHLLTALGGPGVNLFLCIVCGGALAFDGLAPPLNPLNAPYHPADSVFRWRQDATVTKHAPGPARAVGEPPAKTSEPQTAPRSGGPVPQAPTVSAAQMPEPLPGLATWKVIAAQFFWVNWFLFLINLLPGFPLDGGRVLQAILWSRSDYRQAMATASYAGFIVMLVLGIFAVAAWNVLALALAWFVYVSCKQQLIILETGGEEASFGYDFSQGYTSLEGSPAAAPPKRRQPNFIQRWLQRRAARRAQRELEQRGSEDRRMDELLEKVQRQGIQALTDEERRFMTRVSARYRGNRS
jgi:Zn-dependent protease